DKTTDYESLYAGYRLDIAKDNTYKLYYKLFNAIDHNEEGAWVFSGDKKDVIFQETGSNTTSDWRILKLKQKELWGKYTDTNGNELEIHLVPLL
ncbi:MAG TPA: hypothetical protein VFU15_09640, partial [Bacteroidia bacterium]|nr:hypothetical protein [Bacteroidia bacterium]